MLKYNTEQKEFDSWDKTSEFIDNKDYTIWKELGEDLEEKTICKACNSKVNTNSEELLRELREVHHINCSTKMRK